MWKRWQLFHATDFQSLMYPNFVFCRILGIFPYKINASTFETSKQRYILPTLLICIVCMCEIIMFSEITEIINYEDVTDILEYVSYFIISGFIALTTYVLSGPRMRVLQALLEISSRLSPESYRKLSKWIHLKDILGTFFLIMQTSLYYGIREDFDFYMLDMYIYLLVFQMDMQYINCVCILKACFKRINDYLLHMQKIVINHESYAPRLICHTQKNQFLLIKLKILKKQHLLISNTVQKINIVFSLQLLSTITLTFTEITFAFYFHLIDWQNGMSITLDEIRDIFFLLFMGYDFLKLILIVWACETGKNQAFEIGTIIHDVLNRTRDEQIKEEVEKM